MHKARLRRARSWRACRCSHCPPATVERLPRPDIGDAVRDRIGQNSAGEVNNWRQGVSSSPDTGTQGPGPPSKGNLVAAATLPLPMPTAIVAFAAGLRGLFLTPASAAPPRGDWLTSGGHAQRY